MNNGAARAVLLVALAAAGVAAFVLVRPRAAAPELFRMTSVVDAHQLGPVGYRDPAGAISPDGRWVAYSEGRFLRVRATDGGPLIDLPAGEAQIRSIAWSPDNRTILADGFGTQTGWALYDRVDASHRPLWADRDPMRGGKISDLRQPTWSPDGRSIAAIVNGRDGQELWTIAADGSSANAQHVPGRIAFPAWTPRGELACVTTTDGRARVTIPCGGTVVKTDPDRGRLRADRVLARRGDGLRHLRQRIGHARPVGRAVRRRTRAPVDVVRARHLRADGFRRRQRALQSPELPDDGGGLGGVRRREPAARDVSERDAVVGSFRPVSRDHVRHMAPGRRRRALSGHRAGRGHHPAGSG